MPTRGSPEGTLVLPLLPVIFYLVPLFEVCACYDFVVKTVPHPRPRLMIVKVGKPPKPHLGRRYRSQNMPVLILCLSFKIKLFFIYASVNSILREHEMAGGTVV